MAQPQETGTVSRLFDGADPNRECFDPWSPFFLIVIGVVVVVVFRLHPNAELFRSAMLKTWSWSTRLAVEVIDAHELKLEFTQKTSIHVERGGPGQPAGIADRGPGGPVHGELSLAAR